MENTKRILEGQIRECYGRVVYSHKTHEKCADILLDRLSQIKLWQIILSAVTTGSLVAIVISNEACVAIIGAIFSTVLLVLNAYTKNYDLGELSQKHKQAANDIWLIRERYLSLLTDLATNQKPLEQAQEERDRLLNDLHAVYAGSPSTTYAAYKKAQDALQRQQDLTFSDAEIDAFLPQALRRG